MTPGAGRPDREAGPTGPDCPSGSRPLSGAIGPAAKRWDLPPPSPTHSLPQDLPPAAVAVLLGRGIDSGEKLRGFLQPPHRLPYDPMRLGGMDRALPRLYQALRRGEKVGIFGDFDVDGLTGTAIIAQGLELMGVPVAPYLPHRVDEGHGLSDEAVQHLAAQGVSLIVTVDCGVTSVAEVDRARRQGVDVIISDHHTPQATLPPAVAIINPRVGRDQYPFPDLCGAGLAFKLMQGLYQFHGQPWPPELLGLAALGTVADLVPLVDENRFLVQQGLAELARTQRPGLQALYRRAGINPQRITTETLAFHIAPRLNSAGRMSHALESYQLLTTDSEAEAEALADRLEGLNQDRRGLTEAAYAIARDQVQRHAALPPILLVDDPVITPGVAGLVAGRLAEVFHRPAVALASLGDGLAVASGRSIPQFNIVKAFAACQDLLVRYGGHAQAAGFTVARRNLPELAARLAAYADERLAPLDLRPALAIDAEVRLAELGNSFLPWLATLEPFGAANPQPLFLTRGARVMESRQMGQSGQHLRLRLRDPDKSGQDWTALAFNQAAAWQSAGGTGDTQRVDLVYSLTSDSWRGADAVALRVVDLRPAAP
jgi:single-stranded-DNA-specific exonuclease